MKHFLKTTLPGIVLFGSVAFGSEGPGATGGELPPYVEPFKLVCSIEHLQHKAKAGWIKKAITHTFTKDDTSLKDGNAGIYVEGIPARFGKQRYRVDVSMRRLADVANKTELVSESVAYTAGDENEVRIEGYLQALDEKRAVITLQRITVRCAEQPLE